MIEVFMPKLGPSIEQATVVRWHKARGEAVRRGEPIVDIETDKTVQEVEAEADGVLHEVFVAEGQACAVGTVLALLGSAGEEAASPVVASAPPAIAAAVASVQPADVVAPVQPAIAASASTQRTIAADVSPAGSSPWLNIADDIERVLVKASPAARRVAREKGVDLSVVTGTGPRGRVVAEDVLRAAAAAEVLAQAARPEVDIALPMQAEPAAAIAGCAVKERRPLGSVRRRIADRMLQSKQSAPDFWVAMDVDMSLVKAARDRWLSCGEDPVPSYNDFVLFACARALREFPELNASLAGDEVVIYSDVNVGMATAAPDGLVVPVIRNAERMSVRGVASRSRELASRARDRKLLPADCEGGTFTVSNLGMFGVDRFVAIINPPQCAILAVGQVAPRVITDGHSISIRVETTLTLSVDHRIADGVVASRFLGSVKRSLETFESNA